MELTLLSSSLSFASSSSTVIRDCKPKAQIARNLNTYSASRFKSLEQGRNKSTICSALPETAASVVLAATVVGAAATYLVRITKASEAANAESSLRSCEDCGGSGICSECKGEGFVVKKLSDEKAQRARLTAKNMATRYTAGLPKKWSYCTRCSSSRSCIACGGSGQLNPRPDMLGPYEREILSIVIREGKNRPTDVGE